MFLGHVERFECLHHSQIVLMIFGGELGREQIEIGFAQDIAEWFADKIAKAPIGKGEAPLAIFAQDVLGKGLDQR